MPANPYLDSFTPVGADAEPDATLPPARVRIERAITVASDWLLARQVPQGWWCGTLQGDSTLESYLILLEAFLGRRTDPRVARFAARVRTCALPTGGWAAYPGGPAELSVSTLAYFALKVAGEPADAAHMQRSRDVIVALGGAGRANSYTRYHLALFGQYPWGDVPAIPPEIIFLPAGGPFSVYDMSAWSRTIFVPLSIVYALQPTCTLPPSCGVPELFSGGRDRTERAADDLAWRRLFGLVDRGLKQGQRLPGAAMLRRRSVARAAAWMIERLERSDGLGAILPAMVTSVIALRALGHGLDSPLVRGGIHQLERLFVEDETSGGLQVQPCLSPVWDTCLAVHALAQVGVERAGAALARAASWLRDRQILHRGDWAERNPAPPGGWAFEFRNDFYPDVDDTCMALMVLRQVPTPDVEATRAAIDRGLAWMLGMQNQDGGWASFDRDNDKQWLTHVPFADHNAMIDPSTADITGRVLECLSHFEGFGPAHPVVKRAIAFLRKDQCPDGSWFGRWGVNYIYGTWQVLRGLRCIGADMDDGFVRRAADWLLGHQNPDGGWGESIVSYDDPGRKGRGPSTPSQTAWALMGLIAACQSDGIAARGGVRWLLDHQRPDGTWDQAPWTGTGFPRVFYLDYPYYRHYFPLMALAQYRRARFPAPVAAPP